MEEKTPQKEPTEKADSQTELPPRELQELETSEKLEEMLTENEEKMFVLFFHAEWCGACENITPFLQNVAAANPDIEFIKIDVDVHEPLVISYELLAIPTFVFTKGKKIVTKSLGANEKTFSLAFDKLKKVDEVEPTDEQPPDGKKEHEKAPKHESEKAHKQESEKPEKSALKQDKAKK